MKQRLSNRANTLAPSLTLAVTAKAQQLKAEGIDIISLSAGEPDFDTPETIAQAGIQAIQDGKSHYTAGSGTVALRQAIANKVKTDTGLSYKVEQICVSSGAKHSLMNVLLAVVDEGDEVLIPSPYWVSYTEMVKICDGKPVLIETKAENRFLVTVDELNNKLTNKTKVLMLNSPSNPTGSAYTKEELEKIADWAIENDIFVISDEIYSKLLYNGTHTSIASVRPEMADLTFIINGVSKAYAMTGWRIGYVCGPEDVLKGVHKLQSQMTSNPCSIAQEAAQKAMESDDSILTPMLEAFKRRRDYCFKRVDAIEGMKVNKPDGAFYLFIDVSSFYNETIKNSIDFANYLLEDAQVAVVPGIGFGNDDYIRISFATSDALLEEAMDRIEKAVDAIR